MSKRLTYSEVVELFDHYNCKLISCDYKDNRTLMDYICECGNISKITLSNLKKGRKCKICGDKKRTISKALDPTIVYEDIESKGYKILNRNFRNVSNKLCLECSNNHTIHVSYRSLRGNNYSCFKCSRESKRGENHHNYIHGLSKEHREDRNKCRVLHNEWKRSLLQIFRYKCNICSDSTKLAAHHLNGYNWDIENRYNIENGVILCKYHHDKFHNLYGRGNNTSNQFDEFKIKELV